MDGTGDEWDTDNTKESTHYVGSFRSHAEGQATWLGRETGGGASRVMSVCELGYGSLPCVLWTDPRVEKEQGREPKLHINYTNLIDLQGLFIHQLNHAETTPNVSHGPSDPQAPPLLTHNIFFSAYHVADHGSSLHFQKFCWFLAKCPVPLLFWTW